MRCISDVILPGGVEHRIITRVVKANLDGADHPEPVVEKSFLRFAAASSRDEAIKLADAGDLDGAARVLHEAVSRLEPYGDDAELVQEKLDLVKEAAEIAEKGFSAADRKYMQASAMGPREGKLSYRDKLRRPGKK